MGCHFLLQEIFLTLGSNPSLLYLLYCRQILYTLSHWEEPRAGKQAISLSSVDRLDFS